MLRSIHENKVLVRQAIWTIADCVLETCPNRHTWQDVQDYSRVGPNQEKTSLKKVPHCGTSFPCRAIWSKCHQHALKVITMEQWVGSKKLQIDLFHWHTHWEYTNTQFSAVSCFWWKWTLGTECDMFYQQLLSGKSMQKPSKQKHHLGIITNHNHELMSRGLRT